MESLGRGLVLIPPNDLLLAPIPQRFADRKIKKH